MHFAWPGKDYIPLGVYVLIDLPHPIARCDPTVLSVFADISPIAIVCFLRLTPLLSVSCLSPASPPPPYLFSLTNSKPSSIYRLRPHLPSDLPPNALASPPATLGIEIAPLPQLEALAAQLSAGGEGKGKEIAGKVDVGKVAEKVVKNVSGRRSPHRGFSGLSGLCGLSGLGGLGGQRRAAKRRIAGFQGSIADGEIVVQLPALFR